VQWTKSCVAEEFQFVRGIAKGAVKAVVQGPVTLVRATEPKEGLSEEKLLSLYEGILRKEVEALAAQGAKEIQLDEPSFSPDEPLLEKGIEAVNRIFDGVKARRWVACYFHDLSSIFPALSRIEVEVLALDLVTAPQLAQGLARAGWKGEVALGLVDARNTKLESKEELKKKIEEVAKAIPVDRLWLSPNCGLEFLPHASAIKKLRLLKEAAASF
jgi:5-methyltetrahydropteroyltriglutamate--homocysteine methyltransferase